MPARTWTSPLSKRKGGAGCLRHGELCGPQRGRGPFRAYIDVIRPSAQAAAAATKNGKIGVIGTAATIHSDSYRSALLCLNHKLQVFPQACPLFVSLVESGFVSPQDEVTRLVAERYLAPVRAAGVDTLILGCTHYPIIAPTIGSVMAGGSPSLTAAGKPPWPWPRP